MLPSDSEDEAQDRVPLAERIRQASLVLHHSPALQSVLATGAGTSIVAVGAGGMPRAPPTSSQSWDTGLWGISLDELL
jgi:hypothetical protein